MDVGHIPGTTRVLGESQGYIGLPIRDVIEVNNATMAHTPAMQSVWYPTADEMKMLLSGAAIRLIVLGSAHPPVRLEMVSHEELGKELEHAKTEQIQETGEKADEAR